MPLGRLPRKIINFVQTGAPKTIRQLRLICHPVLRGQGRGPRVSMGNKTNRREMRRADVW